MENASRALEIAAGVLLGVMLFALVAYFFTTLKGSPTQEDEILTAEQLAKFNREYEVYDKNKMYGVDVISCLNKVRSYDDKYVKGDRDTFLTGGKYGEDFVINVKVRLKKQLTESIELSVYNIQSPNGNPTDKEIKLIEVYEGSEIWNCIEGNLSSNCATSLTLKDAFKFKKDESGNVIHYYTNFVEGTKLNASSSKEITSGSDLLIIDLNYSDSTDIYNNLINSSLDYENPLNNLLNLSGEEYMRQIARNTNNDPNDTTRNLGVWSTAIWNTALYDFKKRMFKCDYMHYSDKTGRISEISFSEV